jgi:ATP-dependent exoDNAse (exonuclease V) beta subunit
MEKGLDLKDDVLKKLESFNDPDFKFNEELHQYTYLGDKFTSVTQFISKFHKPFDTDYHSERKSKELGIPKSEILKEWKEKNDYANYIGTLTHNWIEDYFNKKWQKIPTDLDVINRINKFNIIYANHLHKLEPVKFEIRIFSKRWKIAGTFDALFIYGDNLFILDWKTNKFFSTDENIIFREFLLEPFSHLLKTHLNEYTIQIALYCLILEEVGINIKGGYLVHIGPDCDAKIHTCKRLLEIKEILKNYLDSKY